LLLRLDAKDEAPGRMRRLSKHNSGSNTEFNVLDIQKNLKQALYFLSLERIDDALENMRLSRDAIRVLMTKVNQGG